MKLIYFHGFGSSAQSGTIRTLRKMLPDFEVIAPDIPVDPADALPFLKLLCENEHLMLSLAQAWEACMHSRCSDSTESASILHLKCRQ